MQSEKATLRKEFLIKRGVLPDVLRNKQSEIICNHLKQLVTDNNLRVVHTFLPMGDEVDLRPFITWCLENKIVVVATRTLKHRQLQHLVLHDLNNLKEGVYGTRYPAEMDEFVGEYDMIIVPGLIFDATGNRIGYGGGYYDTFLQHQPVAMKVGVGYGFQMIASELPKEKHDVLLDVVVTNEGIHQI